MQCSRGETLTDATDEAPVSLRAIYMFFLGIKTDGKGIKNFERDSFGISEATGPIRYARAPHSIFGISALRFLLQQDMADAYDGDSGDLFGVNSDDEHGQGEGDGQQAPQVAGEVLPAQVVAQFLAAG